MREERMPKVPCKRCHRLRRSCCGCRCPDQWNEVEEEGSRRERERRILLCPTCQFISPSTRDATPPGYEHVIYGDPRLWSQGMPYSTILHTHMLLRIDTIRILIPTILRFIAYVSQSALLPNPHHMNAFSAPAYRSNHSTFFDPGGFDWAMVKQKSTTDSQKNHSNCQPNSSFLPFLIVIQPTACERFS